MRLVLLTIGFIGAALLGAVFGQVLFPADNTLPGRSEDYSRLTAKVEDLGAEVESLRTGILEERASRPLPEADRPSAAASAAIAGVSPGSGAEPGVTIPGAGPDGAASSSLVADAVIEEKVRETVNEIAREQREERARRAEAEAVARENAWLKEMQPQIGLTDYQVEELGTLLKERRHTLASFKRKAADFAANGTPQQQEALEQSMNDYRVELKGEILKVVSQDQYEGILRWSADKRKQGGGNR